MERSSSLLIASSMVLPALLNACATSSGVVPDSERDTSGKFDGAWIIEVLETANTQQTFGNWILNCEDMAWEFASQCLTV